MLAHVCIGPETIFAQSLQSNHTLAFSELQSAYGSRINDIRWNSYADLNHDGIVNLKDLVLYGQIETTPLILDFSSNLLHNEDIPDSGVVFMNVIVDHANQCILSYTVRSTLIDNASETSIWINETMMGQGNGLFNGTINTCSMPPNAFFVYYKIDATNRFNLSNETDISRFVLWNDP